MNLSVKVDKDIKIGVIYIVRKKLWKVLIQQESSVK